MTPDDAVTVAVCSRDRPVQLAGCLAAVRAALRPQDGLLVVDSASVDGRTRAVAREAGAQVLRADLPGLSRARNLALSAATTEVVLFTDDDCRPRPGWVAAVASAFAADPRVGFVTGRVLAEGDGAPTAVHDEPEPRRLDAGTPLEQMGHGANMAVRVAAVREIGGYDPWLGAGAEFRAGEDTDVYRRLVDAGWVGRYVPGAAVAHDQWRSRWQAVRMAYGYGLGFGAVAAKAAATDRSRGRGLLRRGLYDAGLAQAWRDARNHYELGVVVCLAWTGGVGLGHRRARRRGLEGAVLRAPGRR